MEIIEFLQRTDQKNLKNVIGFKVKRKLQEYELELQERRDKLRNIFEFENMQLNEELLMLVQQRVETAARQRLDWINTKCMERQKAEEELLKVKKLQRELENCEEWSHRQTHQLLLETKLAQLHQIEEKQQRCAREQLIEQNWLTAMEQLRQEKEFQQNYEDKLRKVVEAANQQKNLALQDDKRTQERLEQDTLRRDYHEDNLRALALDRKYKTDQKLSEMYKKLQQEQWLKSQIAANRQRELSNEQKAFQENLIFKNREEQQIYDELDEGQREKVRNNEWHKLYLKHCAQERQLRLQAELQHEQMYLNTGCVLQQKPKNPYSKTYR